MKKLTLTLLSALFLLISSICIYSDYEMDYAPDINGLFEAPPYVMSSMDELSQCMVDIQNGETKRWEYGVSGTEQYARWIAYVNDPASMIGIIEDLEVANHVSVKNQLIEFDYRIPSGGVYWFRFYFDYDAISGLLTDAKQVSDMTETVCGHEVYSYVAPYDYNAVLNRRDMRTYVWEQDGYVMQIIDFREDVQTVDFSYYDADMYTIAEFIEQFETVTIDTPQEGKTCPEE